MLGSRTFAVDVVFQGIGSAVGRQSVCLLPSGVAVKAMETEQVDIVAAGETDVT